MYITRIRIKNFRVIREIDINLDVNKNKIEKDVAKDRFKILDNKRVVSGITALVGRNSVGKSTIIKALSFIKDVETGFINKEIINNLIKDEVANIQSKEFFKNPQFDNNSLVEINKIIVQKSREISENIKNKKNLDFDRYILNSTEWFSEYFKHNYHNDDSKKIEFIINFISKNNREGSYLLSLDKNGNILKTINGHFSDKDYHNYFLRVFAPIRNYVFESRSKPGLLDTRRNQSSYYHLGNVEIALENFIYHIGDKMTVKLIKLCDEDVLDIKYSTAQNNSRIRIKGIILQNRIVQPENLSNGTKQFIVLAEAIVTSFKMKAEYGLLLFDEIEINLHNELIQAILHMLISLFKKLGVQSIITTHNLKSLKPLISNKQIFSIEKNEHKNQVFKASTIMKEHENILTKQEQGKIADYPDGELIRNTIADFIYEIEKK